MHKKQLAETQYRDKLEKDKTEFRLNTKKHKRKNKKVKKIKEECKNYTHQLQKYKNGKKLQKKKLYEFSKRTALVTKQSKAS